MSDAGEIFEAIGEVVDDNTSETGIDVVNVYGSLVEALKANPDMTVEDWELFRMSINNGIAIMNNLVDAEIDRLKKEEE